ncbi:hypothetical protein T484DRAFT_1919609 [Baffinella frigidus]|nr:hypothetical protein T484DRAFT_1919609 [Cryptophyta sp. CCMP2293]
MDPSMHWQKHGTPRNVVWLGCMCCVVAVLLSAAPACGEPSEALTKWRRHFVEGHEMAAPTDWDPPASMGGEGGDAQGREGAERSVALADWRRHRDRVAPHERERRDVWASSQPCRGGEHVHGRWVRKGAQEGEGAPCCDVERPWNHDPDVCGPSEMLSETQSLEEDDPRGYFLNHQFVTGWSDFLTPVGSDACTCQGWWRF